MKDYPLPWKPESLPARQMVRSPFDRGIALFLQRLLPIKNPVKARISFRFPWITRKNLPLPEEAGEDKELIQEEVAATNEGMPAGELDEDPPKAEGAAAGE